MHRAVSPLVDAFPTLRREKLGLVDVGTRGGIHPIFNGIAPLLHVVGFEPDTDECRWLTAAGAQWGYAAHTCVPCGLGRVDGEQALDVCRSEGTSSCYRPNRVWLERFPDAVRYEVVGTKTIPVRSLDSLRSDPAHQLPTSIDFLKVDTQGSELDVLMGAQRTLSQAVGVEVEVEFAQLYESQPLFRDVDAYLASCGFSLFKLRRYGWVRKNQQAQPRHSAGQLIFGDALYLRDPLHPQHPDSSLTPHQAEALVVIATLYDLRDFALEVVLDRQMSHHFDRERVVKYIHWNYRSLGRSWPLVALKPFLESARVQVWLETLHAWNRRQSWGRADSSLDFYTLNMASRRWIRETSCR